MTSTPVRDRAHWHELRAAHVGASESAALFGLSPWLSRWQLHMIKTGLLPAPDLEDNLAVAHGRHFEPAVATYAAEKFGIRLRKVQRYLTADDCAGMGASLDYEQFGDGQLIPVEIKFSLHGDWDWQGEEIIEAPEYYLIQCQHQLACMPSAPHAVLLAFTGGDLRRMIVPRRETMIAAIKREVATFWTDLRAGKEPPIDFAVDAEAIGRLAAISPLCRVELPAYAQQLAADYLAAKASAADCENMATAARAELTKLLLDLAAERGAVVDEQKVVANLGPYRLSATAVAGNPGTVISQEMVGTVIGQRNGYRRITISEPKPKKGRKAA